MFAMDRGVFFPPCEIRPELAFGDVVGAYRIVVPIGFGGFGMVYRALHRFERTQVALKVTRADAVGTDPLAGHRLLREARLLAQIDHHGVAALVDVGRCPDGRTFAAMEHVEGPHLHDVIEVQKFDLPEVLQIASRIANALCAVHEAGVVHGDVTPHNIMLRWSNGVVQPVLIDFGNSHAAGESSGLPAGTIAGTPYYMSPEQACGKKMDHRSDIYSFGTILYELVAGEPMFDADSARQILHQHLHDDPPTLRTDDYEVPAELRRIVSRCVAKSQRRRYRRTRDLAKALRKLSRQFEVRPPSTRNDRAAA